MMAQHRNVGRLLWWDGVMLPLRVSPGNDDAPICLDQDIVRPLGFNVCAKTFRACLYAPRLTSDFASHRAPNPAHAEPARTAAQRRERGTNIISTAMHPKEMRGTDGVAGVSTAGPSDELLVGFQVAQAHCAHDFARIFVNRLRVSRATVCSGSNRGIIRAAPWPLRYVAGGRLSG